MDPTLVIILGITFGLLAIAGLIFWLVRRRNRSSVADALRGVALARIDDALIPNGMGGEIHLEHVVLTAKGILVVDVKRYEGIVFASELMDPWTSIGSRGRVTFRNPLPPLYDRVAAVRQFVKDVDVRGVLVFPTTADFSKGRPDGVLLAPDLLADYAKPDRPEAERLNEAFRPHWERICEVVKPAAQG